ncbi:hypothetical protein L3Q82_015346 [Scortum barcoo]|uniref:Uncharacterized protein n=1 Tax=Scortum barcoo TaxID=214431 RepID=A0ACB8VUA3_9TELE|nr:hypothetical protein L3Q82_015346 [Scortum barcoo]
MSSSIVAAPDSHLAVRYTRKVAEKRGDGEENEVEIFEDEEHHVDLGSQKANVLVTLEKEQLQIINDKLKNISDMAANHSQLLSSYKTLSENYKQLQEEIKKLKVKTEVCPGGWKRFGRNCYFKSNEKKNWYESRKYCENKGAHLVIINDKEEQKFVSELSVDGESWIGLQAEWIYAAYGTNGYYEWRWVDRSALTEPFWASGQQHITDNWKSAACCDQEGKWTKNYYYDEKKWICEKQIS